MKPFPYGHATHPQWQMAAGLVLAQLKAQMATHGGALPLALVYITDHYAKVAEPLLALLRAELPEVLDWCGTVGVGIAVNNAEYFDEPALAVMLCDVPQDQYRVFSGLAPLAALSVKATFQPQVALVHADGDTPDLPGMLAELAARTTSAYLFGGLSSSRAGNVQFALASHAPAGAASAESGLSKGVFDGGLSGVAFGPGVALVSRVTQGCQPIGQPAARMVTACADNVVLALDGQPALAALLSTLGVSLSAPQTALSALRSTLVGITSAGQAAVRRTGHFGAEVLVRHIIGIDPQRQGVAVGEALQVGDKLAFCQRDVAAARVDLVRICAEIREEMDETQRQITGAVYVSCIGRGGPHFGAPSAEMQIVRHALGDVPLVGFFAGGEIAHQHLYGYTGVLTVFAA